MSHPQEYRYLVVDKDGKRHDCCQPLKDLSTAEADVQFHNEGTPHRAPFSIRDLQEPATFTDTLIRIIEEHRDVLDRLAKE